MRKIQGFRYPDPDPSKNLGGWTVGHHHFCVHCKNMGKLALETVGGKRSGHPYGTGYDAYRHECPVCLQFWFSNDWSGEGVPERKEPKFIEVPNPAASIVRGARQIPIWMLPPKARKL